MDIFVYDNANGEIKLNEPEILLTKEFSELYNDKRNVCKTDKTGKQRLRAFREFKYIWLTLDWKSIYDGLLEQEKHECSLVDSGLSQEEFDDVKFRAACRKYQEIQDSDISIQLLQGAKITVKAIIYKLQNPDLDALDANGKPVYKLKDTIAELKGCKDLISSLTGLENEVKKGLEGASKLRGGQEEGYFDD